jgi:hypothetical protein
VVIVDKHNKITRKSDHFKAIVPGFSGLAYCTNCHERLRAMKANEFNLKCWECGDEVPIKSIKFDTALAMVDSQPSTIVQARNWKRGLSRARDKNPIQQELEGRGLTVIQSDWRDQKP